MMAQSGDRAERIGKYPFCDEKHEKKKINLYEYKNGGTRFHEQKFYHVNFSWNNIFRYVFSLSARLQTC